MKDRHLFVRGMSMIPEARDADTTGSESEEGSNLGPSLEELYQLGSAQEDESVRATEKNKLEGERVYRERCALEATGSVSRRVTSVKCFAPVI